jgi:hypothetical protein
MDIASASIASIHRSSFIVHPSSLILHPSSFSAHPSLDAPAHSMLGSDFFY